MPVDGLDYLSSEMGPCILGAPVHLHESLRMHLKADSAPCHHRIMVFDTVAESRHMRSPLVNPGHVMHLFDIGGKLAVPTNKDQADGRNSNLFVQVDRAWSITIGDWFRECIQGSTPP
jgi:hypothetical protein